MRSKTLKWSLIAFLTAATFVMQAVESQAGHRARCRRAYRHGCCATTSCQVDHGGTGSMDSETPPAPDA